MSQTLNVGDPVWANIPYFSREIAAVVGSVVGGNDSSPIYDVRFADSSGDRCYSLTQDRVRWRHVPCQPDPIESAVSAMATNCTAQPSADTTDKCDSITRQQLKAAIYLLRTVEGDDHKLLGHRFARVAIAAALPLLQSVFDEID